MRDGGAFSYAAILNRLATNFTCPHAFMPLDMDTQTGQSWTLEVKGYYSGLRPEADR